MRGSCIVASTEKRGRGAGRGNSAVVTGTIVVVMPRSS